MREDPKLRELSDKLRQSNELYQAARKVAESQKNEIWALHRAIEELAEKLNKANELYEAAKVATGNQKSEIEDLNRQVVDLLRSKKKDKEKLEVLKARLIVLIREMQKAA